MRATLKFVFRKVNKDETLGYVAIQRIENRSKTYRSLGLPKFDIRHWDGDKERVRKTTKLDYQSYNDTIDMTLASIIAEGKSLDNYDGVNSKASFLHYFNQVVHGTELKKKHGTRIKYQTVYKKLEGFLSEQGKHDLLFSELNSTILAEFQLYMRESGLENNTAVHYLKIVKLIFNKSQKEESVLSGYDPFVKYKFEKKERKIKETLTSEDIFKLIDAQIGKDRLIRVRDLFLFQFFTGGMRVSDLVTLRFNNLVNGRVSYRMYKTRQELDVPINDKILHLLKSLLNLQTELDEPVDEEMNILELMTRRKELLRSSTEMLPDVYKVSDEVLEGVPLSVVVDGSYWLESNIFIRSLTMVELLKERARLSTFIDSEGVLSMREFKSLYRDKSEFLQRMLTNIEQRIEFLKKTHHDACIQELNMFAEDAGTSDHFVFGMLKNSDFEDVDGKNDFGMLNDVQYKKVNKAGIVYNRNLKELRKTIGLSKKLSTHAARTSFTNIMMHSGASTMDISKTLGHSSLSITDEYLKTGFNNGRTDEVLKALGDQFR